ncbi:hypothetical protein ACP4OV_007436 [Aristida adscensionis]
MARQPAPVVCPGLTGPPSSWIRPDRVLGRRSILELGDGAVVVGARRIVGDERRHCSRAGPEGESAPAAGIGIDDDENSGDSSTNSKESSEVEVPSGIELGEWSGIDTESPLRYRHLMPPRRLIVWDSSMSQHTGRRFFACPLEDQLEQCDFLVWHDQEWPEMVKKVFTEVWMVLDSFCDGEVEARMEAVEARMQVDQKEELLRQKEEELRRARTIARHACSYWQAMMNSTMQEKIRVTIVSFILAGVILVLLICLLAEKKKPLTT